MAIAFDAKTHLSDAGGAVASKTQAHTVTGSNPYLVVFTEGSTTSDRITGVTYNSVAMTKVDVQKGDSGRYITSWVLANPATGSNNVVISSSPNDIIGASILSFTGCQSGSTPDSHATATTPTGTSLAATTTVVGANCWLIGFAHGETFSAGSGTTIRSETTADGYVSGDSNGTVSTGSQSLNFTWVGSNVASGLVLSVAPAAAVATSDNMFQGANF
jgi:hypothetical protein